VEALVDESARVLDEQRPAVGDVTTQVLGASVGQEEQGRRDDKPVAAQLLFGAGEVDRDTGVPQSSVCSAQ
jgi:hypothetical protein